MTVKTYGGWIGINGQITTPTTAPSLDPTQDANAGWIGETYPDSNGTKTWLQIGWYTGIIGGTPSNCPWGDCVYRHDGTYGMYVEYQSSVDHGIYDLGTLSYGQKVIYRVEYTSGGCWNAYYNYNHLAWIQCYLTNSGVMEAANELIDYSGTAMMARSEFGTAAGGTNATLRIRGGCRGYEDWGQSLCAGGTGQIDERGIGTHNGNIYMSPAKLYWDLVTYQG